MWTTLSVSRWICLLTLAVMMLSAASQVGVHIPCTCSGNLTNKTIHVIKKCYEQIARLDCNHAFVISNKKGQFCIKPDAEWLQKKIKTDNLHCPPDLSF